MFLMCLMSRLDESVCAPLSCAVLVEVSVMGLGVVHGLGTGHAVMDPRSRRVLDKHLWRVSRFGGNRTHGRGCKLTAALAASAALAATSGPSRHCPAASSCAPPPLRASYTCRRRRMTHRTGLDLRTTAALKQGRSCRHIDRVRMAPSACVQVLCQVLRSHRLHGNRSNVGRSRATPKSHILCPADSMRPSLDHDADAKLNAKRKVADCDERTARMRRGEGSRPRRRTRESHRFHFVFKPEGRRARAAIAVRQSASLNHVGNPCESQRLHNQL
ncbi:hypothetical protein C8R43DRAFT_1237201 [Mycena crocata]|nr:hypothetical protein C8R43DRAFT_1237201 [Mycena crocata]